MIRHLSEWWAHLGYCWNRGHDEFRTFGVRPWRGAPFFRFVIDKSGKAVQSKKHVASCVECQDRGVEAVPPRGET